VERSPGAPVAGAHSGHPAASALLFVGEADPVAIRDALLALDGDRSAAGFPPVPPFDARWSDAIGDAQTNWSGVEGWGGSVIQLPPWAT